MAKYADTFGMQVDEAAWEEDYEKVVRGLGTYLEQATGTVLTSWDNPARGGIYLVGREEYEDGREITVSMRPNFVPESGDWGMDDYREHTVIASVFGNNRKQVDNFQKAILASRGLGAVLLERTVHRPGQKREIAYSLKDTA